MTAQRRISALLALLPLLPLIPPVAADCYWPDGSAAYDQHECYGADGADGLCCAEGDLCLLNRLCQARGPAPAALYRGACSLPGDTNSTCATMCTDARGGSDLAGEQPVGRCSGAGDTFYCDTGGDDDDEAVGLRNCSSFASDVQVYTLSGCLEEYNTAGNATVLTVSPTCSAAPTASATASVKHMTEPSAAKPSGLRNGRVVSFRDTLA